jgi:cbb3-type cytochrome oxidase subunit 3
MKMKFVSSVFLLLLSLCSYAQVLKPIKWTYEPSKKEAKAGEQIDLVFTAIVEKDWYVYSSDFDPDLGPQVTTFTLNPMILTS